MDFILYLFIVYKNIYPNSVFKDFGDSIYNNNNLSTIFASVTQDNSETCNFNFCKMFLIFIAHMHWSKF